jgi:hypothetical protein
MAELTIKILPWISSAKRSTQDKKLTVTNLKARNSLTSLHQENSMLLDWLEPAPLVVLALQHMSWVYVDLPLIQHRCWGRKLLAPAP